jgi:hypothetical protein
MAFGSQIYTHEGAVRTHPSHDLLHLIVAANGQLPWAPQGDMATVKLAEYNVVFLEHLLGATFSRIATGRGRGGSDLPGTLAHMRWFVEKYFRPFPASAEQAYAELSRNIDVSTIVRLLPCFFALKRSEALDALFMQKSWRVEEWADSPLGRPEGDVAVFVREAEVEVNRLATTGLAHYRVVSHSQSDVVTH